MPMNFKGNDQQQILQQKYIENMSNNASAVESHNIFNPYGNNSSNPNLAQDFAKVNQLAAQP